ncbi:LacI family DNA-binding transcriptional regulator [Actinocorallia longicatena]|uniref:LacI family DNA-binding transcriptional regulator n=1 Tax=Actinocorallia longicatena TaxID=111803 RepID=A0ABP6Q7V7_9ACTN
MDGQRRRARQADVAKLAGVSQATVSAVINGRGPETGIPEQTVLRVQEAVRQLGYVANPAARSLRGKRNRLLGVHTFESIFPIDQLDFYHAFLVGIEQQAIADGYDLVLFASTEDPDGRRRIYRDGVNRLALADGSVLLGVEDGSTELAKLAAEGYPFVHIGRRTVPGSEIAWVGADYANATRDIVARLAGLGHRRIAYVTGPDRMEVFLDKEAGYRSGCADAGLPELMYVTSQLDPAWVDAAHAGGVTAVLAENDVLGRQLVAALAERGMSAPADMSLVVLVTMTEDGWSSLRIPRDEMGRGAVKMLTQILGGDPALGEHQRLLPCGLPADDMIGPPRG